MSDLPAVAYLPSWGSPESRKWGVDHPDCPWHTAESRAKYEYPTGSWWRRFASTDLPTPGDNRSAR